MSTSLCIIPCCIKPAAPCVSCSLFAFSTLGIYGCSVHCILYGLKEDAVKGS